MPISHAKKSKSLWICRVRPADGNELCVYMADDASRLMLKRALTEKYLPGSQRDEIHYNVAEASKYYESPDADINAKFLA